MSSFWRDSFWTSFICVVYAFGCARLGHYTSRKTGPSASNWPRCRLYAWLAGMLGTACLIQCFHAAPWVFSSVITFSLLMVPDIRRAARQGLRKVEWSLTAPQGGGAGMTVRLHYTFGIRKRTFTGSVEEVLSRLACASGASERPGSKGVPMLPLQGDTGHVVRLLQGRHGLDVELAGSMEFDGSLGIMEETGLHVRGNSSLQQFAANLAPADMKEGLQSALAPRLASLVEPNPLTPAPVNF
jgi:hypothetical protein